MEVFAEKQAEDFLEKQGFKVVKRTQVFKKEELKQAVESIGFPLVMKVSGREIIHKNKLGGIVLNIEDYEHALESFDCLMNIKNAEGVMMQKQLAGREFILGLKKTPEFGHVVAFGLGGSKVEEIKKVVFRVCMLDRQEAREMIEEVLGKSEERLENNVLRLCRLSGKYPEITELDINPLIVNQDALIADARISFS